MDLWKSVKSLEDRLVGEQGPPPGKWAKLKGTLGMGGNAVRGGAERISDKVRSLEEAHAELQKTLARTKREARIRQKVSVAIGRYVVQGDRTPEFSIPFSEVKNDGNPEWIVPLLSGGKLSEEEHAAFSYFQDSKATILDIGANLGYSVTSFLNAGAKSNIISFEPNQHHLACLEKLKELKPGIFDYAPIGLSAEEADVQFVMPTCDGVGLSALMTADIKGEADWAIPENFVNYVLIYAPDSVDPKLQFCEMTWRVERLDHALATRKFRVPVDNITAIKLDVEGHELAVLKGAVGTMRKHKPLFLVEGANRVPPVLEFFAQEGYRFAEFEAGRIKLSDAPSERTNGFYVHGGRVAEYRALGLLV